MNIHFIMKYRDFYACQDIRDAVQVLNKTPLYIKAKIKKVTDYERYNVSGVRFVKSNWQDFDREELGYTRQAAEYDITNGIMHLIDAFLANPELLTAELQLTDEELQLKQDELNLANKYKLVQPYSNIYMKHIDATDSYIETCRRKTTDEHKMRILQNISDFLHGRKTNLPFNERDIFFSCVEQDPRQAKQFMSLNFNKRPVSPFDAVSKLDLCINIHGAVHSNPAMEPVIPYIPVSDNKKKLTKKAHLKQMAQKVNRKTHKGDKTNVYTYSPDDIETILKDLLVKMESFESEHGYNKMRHKKVERLKSILKGEK